MGVTHYLNIFSSFTENRWPDTLSILSAAFPTERSEGGNVQIEGQPASGLSLSNAGLGAVKPTPGRATRPALGIQLA